MEIFREEGVEIKNAAGISIPGGGFLMRRRFQPDHFWLQTDWIRNRRNREGAAQWTTSPLRYPNKAVPNGVLYDSFSLCGSLASGGTRRKWNSSPLSRSATHILDPTAIESRVGLDGFLAIFDYPH